MGQRGPGRAGFHGCCRLWSACDRIGSAAQGSCGADLMAPECPETCCKVVLDGNTIQGHLTAAALAGQKIETAELSGEGGERVCRILVQLRLQ